MENQELDKKEPMIQAKPKKKKLWLWILLAVILLAAIGGGVWWYVRGQYKTDDSAKTETTATTSDTTATSTSTTSTTTDETADWKTYTDTTHNFSFKYPTDWTANESYSLGSEKLIALDGSSKQPAPIFYILAYNSVGDLPYLNQLDGTGKTNATSLDNYFQSQKLEKSAVKIGAYDGYHATNHPDIGDGKWYYLLNNNHVFVIYFDPYNKTTVGKIFSTFQFTDPTASWKTYTNSTYGFSFKYPDTLTIDEKSFTSDLLSYVELVAPKSSNPTLYNQNDGREARSDNSEVLTFKVTKADKWQATSSDVLLKRTDSYVFSRYIPGQLTGTGATDFYNSTVPAIVATFSQN